MNTGSARLSRVNGLHRQNTDLAANVNIRGVRRNVVAEQTRMDQRLIARRETGIYYREPRERVSVFLGSVFLFSVFICNIC